MQKETTHPPGIVMALDTRLGIDLVRLQLQYHRDAGIRYFFLLLPGDNGNEDISTATSGTMRNCPAVEPEVAIPEAKPTLPG